MRNALWNTMNFIFFTEFSAFPGWKSSVWEPGSQTEDVHPCLPDRGCLDVEHCDVELKAHNLACSNCLASSTYDSIFMTYDLGFMTYELSSAIYDSWPMIDDLLSRTYDLWCIIDGLRPIIYYLSSMGYYWLFTTYFL